MDEPKRLMTLKLLRLPPLFLEPTIQCQFGLTNSSLLEVSLCKSEPTASYTWFTRCIFMLYYQVVKTRTQTLPASLTSKNPIWRTRTTVTWVGGRLFPEHKIFQEFPCFWSQTWLILPRLPHSFPPESGGWATTIDKTDPFLLHLAVCTPNPSQDLKSACHFMAL